MTRNLKKATSVENEYRFKTLKKEQLLVWFSFLTAEVRAIHAFCLMLTHTVLAPFKTVFQEASHPDVEASRDEKPIYSVSYLFSSRMHREILL